MNKVEEYAIEFVENVTKEGISIVDASVRTFFKAHGSDILLYAKNSYFNARFKIRLEEFSKEEEKIDSDTKKEFYENIDSQQLNYLFELFDKARISTFDMHAKILAKLYANLLSSGQLSYHEVVLISNISTMHEKDFIIFHSILKNYFTRVNNGYEEYLGSIIDHKIISNTEGVAIIKFINLGVLIEKDRTGELAFNELNIVNIYPKKIEFILSEYSRYLFDILEDIYEE